MKLVKTAPVPVQAESDHIPYTNHVTPSVIRLGNGSVICILRIAGAAPESMSARLLASLHEARARAAKALPYDGWAVWHHVIRTRSTDYPARAPRSLVARSIDEEWRAHTAGQFLMRNDHYITLVRHPGLDPALRLRHKMNTKGSRSGVEASWVGETEDMAKLYGQLLRPFGPELLTCREGPHGGIVSEPLSFLGALVNAGQWRNLLLPAMEVRRYLPSRRKIFGRNSFVALDGDAPTWGTMLSIKQYSTPTTPAGFVPLLALPYEMIVTQSFSATDLVRAKKKIERLERDIMATDEASADYVLEDLAHARMGAATGQLTYGLHHMSICPLLRQRDGQTDEQMAAELTAAAARVDGALASAGIQGTRETLNMEPLYWGQLPGNFRECAGRAAQLTNRNFAGLASLYTYPGGKLDGNKWGEALTGFPTEARTPYWLNFHAGDLGHFVVLGKTGSGKTAFVLFLLMQSQRLARPPRLVYMDKDRGAEVAIRAAGGTYQVLTPGQSCGWNPWQCGDSEAAVQFLIDLLSQCLRATGCPWDQDHQDQGERATRAVLQLPHEQRSIDAIAAFLPDTGAGSPGHAVKPWVRSGNHGWLFGAEADRFDLNHHWVGVDLTDVLDNAQLRGPAMSYLKYRIRERLGKGPLVIFADEGWKPLKDPYLAASFEDFLKTIRKLDGVFGLGTQQPEDLARSEIAPALAQNVATLFCLPNPDANEDSYSAFNLSKSQIDTILNMPEGSRQVFVRQGGRTAVLDADLSPLGPWLRLLSTTPEKSAICAELRAQYGDDPKDWVSHFLTNGGTA